MDIMVNGKSREIAADTTIERLLADFELGHERIAVEYNREILQSSDFGRIVLKDGDQLEIVRFVGGG